MGKLEGLLTTAEKVNEELLAGVLDGLVEINRETGALLFTPKFENLSSENKILTVILVFLARQILGLANGWNAAVSSIVTDSGIPKGTVGRTLRKLLGNRLIAQDEKRRYYIPSFSLLRAFERIRDEKEKFQK